MSAAWLLTIVTAAVFVLTTAGLSVTYTFSEASGRVIFLGLASLTFPHILLEHAHKVCVQGATQRITHGVTSAKVFTVASERRTLFGVGHFRGE